MGGVQDLFGGALVVGSVSEAVAAAFRGAPRLAPAVAGIKWAYQPIVTVSDDAPEAEEPAEVRMFPRMCLSALHESSRIDIRCSCAAALLTPAAKTVHWHSMWSSTFSARCASVCGKGSSRRGCCGAFSARLLLSPDRSGGCRPQGQKD